MPACRFARDGDDGDCDEQAHLEDRTQQDHGQRRSHDEHVEQQLPGECSTMCHPVRPQLEEQVDRVVRQACQQPDRCECGQVSLCPGAVRAT